MAFKHKATVAKSGHDKFITQHRKAKGRRAEENNKNFRQIFILAKLVLKSKLWSFAHSLASLEFRQKGICPCTFPVPLWLHFVQETRLSFFHSSQHSSLNRSVDTHVQNPTHFLISFGIQIKFCSS